MAKGAKKGMDALIGQCFVVLLGVLGQLGPLALNALSSVPNIKGQSWRRE